MQYGLIEGIRDAQDYIFGKSTVPRVTFQPDGNWEPYLPKYEPQAENWESNGCTVWGTQNQIETFSKRVYGIEPNYSERYTYLLTPVDPRYGADPQKVYECIRAHGLIDNDLFPVPESQEEFLDTTRITELMRYRGKQWLSRYTLMHEWLWTQRPDNALELMKQALIMSPLGVSVSAWWQDENGKYVDNGQRNNHWCMCYRIDDEGIHIFDSYDHRKKVLRHDHIIARAKRIWVNKNTLSALKRQKSILEVILAFMKPDLLDVCEAWIGKDASPNDLVPDEVGCAETVTTLLKKVYPDTPILTGTWTLWDYLRNPKNGYMEVREPRPETIIICATVPGKPFPGHVGIFQSDMTIASNDSKTGRFEKNYTYQSWMERYMTKGGYKVYLYDKKK